MTRWQPFSFEVRDRRELVPVPIAWDAGSTVRGIADGRLLPVLILDTTTRPDIEDMIQAHGELGQGDVESGWSSEPHFDESGVRLVLIFKKPSRCVIVIDFELPRQGVLVDQIVRTGGVWLQAGRPGDRLVTNLDKPLVLAEVPSPSFKAEWDKIYLKALVKGFRRRGLSKGDAKDAAEGFLKQWREFAAFRLRSHYDEKPPDEPDPASG